MDSEDEFDLYVAAIRDPHKVHPRKMPDFTMEELRDLFNREIGIEETKE